MTWRLVWIYARAGYYPLSVRGWLRCWGDLIKASGIVDFYTARGLFKPGALL